MFWNLPNGREGLEQQKSLDFSIAILFPLTLSVLVLVVGGITKDQPLQADLIWASLVVEHLILVEMKQFPYLMLKPIELKVALMMINWYFE